MSKAARERAQDELQRIAKGEVPLNKKLYDECMQEVVEHLQKDSFATFQANTANMLQRSNSLFRKIDTDGR